MWFKDSFVLVDTVRFKDPLFVILFLGHLNNNQCTGPVLHLVYLLFSRDRVGQKEPVGPKV